GGKSGSIAPLRFDFQPAAGCATGQQQVERFLVVGVATGYPVREWGGSTDQVGFVPAYHAAERRIHICNASLHVENPHSSRHGVFHGTPESGFRDKGCLGAGTESRVSPKCE